MGKAAKPEIIDVVVEMGVVRMRASVGESGGESYRARLCLAVDQHSGMILDFEVCEPQDDYIPVLMESFEKVVNGIGGFPRQVQMSNPKLAAELRPILEKIGVEVLVCGSLPNLDDAVVGMMASQKHSKLDEGLLSVSGMKLGRILAFAQAAELFYNAKPWRHLVDDDLIQVDSPAGPIGAQMTQVLGAGGAVFGLGFVASRKAHEDLRSGKGLPRGGVWSMLFGDIDSLPFDDGEMWEKHSLPLAGVRAYPCFGMISRSKGLQHPQPEQLTWAEGLLRAIAATTEDELDSGRWEKTVETFTGPETYKLSLPILLEQMTGAIVPDPAAAPFTARMSNESILRGLTQQLAARGPMSNEDLQKYMRSIKDNPPEFKPTNDAERAQALCYQAHEVRGRRQVQLARQALAIDPDCGDAYCLLGDLAGEINDSLEYYRRAVDAGARQLGMERFEKDAGRFWGIPDTRPYMRARQMLALTLMEFDNYEDASDHLNEMLRLNPHDNQGVRYNLAQCFLLANKLDLLDDLLNGSQYADDFSAEWVFTKALLAFRREGNTDSVRQQLEAAQQRNKYVAPLLVGKAQLPPFSPAQYTSGDEGEAVLCVEKIAPGWHDTPGAVEWLEESMKKATQKIRETNRDRERKKKKRR